MEVVQKSGAKQRVSAGKVTRSVKINHREVVLSFDSRQHTVVLKLPGDSLVSLAKDKGVEVEIDGFEDDEEVLAVAKDVAANQMAEAIRQGMVKDISASGKVPPQVRRALARAEVNDRVLKRSNAVSQGDAAKLLGKNPKNAAISLSRLEEAGKIFRVQTGEGPRYPLFQFDVDQQAVFPVIGKILELTPEDMSGWRLLRFFMLTDADLSDGYEDEIEKNPVAGYPSSLIGKDDDRLIELFRARLANAVEG